ncbi:hypothetical protein [Siphonobacter sp.]|uniref:hypothetical protein n=1 Tax=Siphonobacter sp. TaxID=1869184 RepID=UPI003B3B5BBE
MAKKTDEPQRARTINEFQDALKIQLKFLKKSCKEFDEGDLDEATRMAIIIRILVHDTGASTSLLKHLELKDKIKFLNTSTHFKANSFYVMGFHGLVYAQMVDHGQGLGNPVFVAKFNSLSMSIENQEFISFDEWWTKNIIIQDRHKQEFSRHDLITTVANRDGGAHIDKEIDETFARLSRDHSIGLEYYSKGIHHKMPDLVLHSIRQIAYEVITTLETQIPN